MMIIGITGGVGSGKSEVLKYLKNKHHAYICQADIVARNLQKKGTICYREIVAHFGEKVLQENGQLDRTKLAEIVFHNEEERKVLNGIVHPAVKKRILKLIRQEKRKSETALFILESALLLDDNYDEICDEVWYVYTREHVRRKRLKLSRGYSDEKISAILSSQKSMDEFLEKSDRAIDNSLSFEDTCVQVDGILEKLGFLS